MMRHDMIRQDTERRDSERQDSERQDSERRDSERRDSERSDAERRSGPFDAERPDVGERPAFPSLRPGRRIYCIGDVHGRSDLLAALETEIRADLSRRPVGEAVTIMLGDYIDRGPDSKGVLDILSRGSFPTPLMALRGNHELMLMAFLKEPQEMSAWRRFGALDTLQSYGVPTDGVSQGTGYEESRSLLRSNMPQQHLQFLASTRSHACVDDYFFCHAGVRPGVPLDAQAPRDLLWIRDDFLSYRGQYGKMIVHGHTPIPAPEMLENRINIDTHAYASGRLTCLILEGDMQDVMTSEGEPA